MLPVQPGAPQRIQRARKARLRQWIWAPAI
jgi:hypothetical protein